MVLSRGSSETGAAISPGGGTELAAAASSSTRADPLPPASTKAGSSTTDSEDIGFLDDEPEIPLTLRQKLTRGLGGFACFALVVGMGVLLPLSFNVLGVNQIGLVRNTITNRLDAGTLFRGGRHFTGLGRAFLAFPATVQAIDFSTQSAGDDSLRLGPIRARTQGQLLSIECSLWYRLDAENVGELYLKRGTRYGADLSKEVRQAVAETASQWETVDFFTQRQAIREAMRDATRARLQANDWAVELVDFWLWGVAVPARLDVAIERKLEVEQLQITALNQQAIAFVHADTEVLTNLTLLSAARLHDEASADARRVVGGARAARFAGVTSALALGMGSLAQSLEWGAAATMRWLWWSVAAEASTRVVLPPTASGAASSSPWSAGVERRVAEEWE